MNAPALPGIPPQVACPFCGGYVRGHQFISATDCSVIAVFDEPIITGPITIEHAEQMSGGGFHVRSPHVEAVYPLRQWILHKQAMGQDVWVRFIRPLGDWEKVPAGKAQP